MTEEIKEEICLQVQSATSPFATLAQELKIGLATRGAVHEEHVKEIKEDLKSIRDIINEFKDVYKNNDHANKETARITRENTETLQGLVDGLTELNKKLNVVETDVAPGVTFIKNAKGFAWTTNFIKDNILSLAIIVFVIIYLINKL